MAGDTEDNDWLPLPLPDFGSQPLTDRRREAFACALFEGIDVQAAYELAGFKRPRGNAQRMEREPLIQARVNYLRRELDRADLLMRSVRRRQVRQQLMQIATADRLGLFEEINHHEDSRTRPECAHIAAPPLADESACRFNARAAGARGRH